MYWYLYAFGAAIIWGVHYNLLARAMTIISPITVYWLPTIIMILFLPIFFETLKTDFKSTLEADKITQLIIVSVMFTSFLASLLLYKAIQLYNPVHASLIEITYPVFVTLFALIFFHENHFNWGTIIGGILSLIGAGIIVYTNK